MSSPDPTVTASQESMQRRFAATLFTNSAVRCFAVLDGAAIPSLIESFNKWQPNYVCLYRGVLSPELLCAAPYLVQLDEQCTFCQWLLTNATGQHWGIFAITDTDLRTLARHFRTLHLTRGKNGQKMVFRFYDPRVLHKYLPLFTPAQQDAFFGPVFEYVAEHSQPPHHPKIYARAPHQAGNFAQA